MIEIGTSDEQSVLMLSDDYRAEAFVLTPEQLQGLHTEGEAHVVVNELIQSELEKRVPPVNRLERIKNGLGKFAIYGLGPGLITYAFTKDLEIASFLGLYSGGIITYVSDSNLSRSSYSENQRLLSRTDMLRREFDIQPYST